MSAAEDPSLLFPLLVEQRALEEQVRRAGCNPSAALEIGRAVMTFAALEQDAFAALAPLLDPAAWRELAAEHDEIGRDVELLEWLIDAMPDSPDVLTLTASLLRRTRQHIDRDGRLLARAATLASRPRT